MPANLPPQYFEAEKRYRSAREPEEKIAALEAMLAIMPHHKGTDKLHAALRQKIAKFSQGGRKKVRHSQESRLLYQAGGRRTGNAPSPGILSPTQQPVWSLH